MHERTQRTRADGPAHARERMDTPANRDSAGSQPPVHLGRRTPGTLEAWPLRDKTIVVDIVGVGTVACCPTEEEAERHRARGAKAIGPAMLSVLAEIRRVFDGARVVRVGARS